MGEIRLSLYLIIDIRPINPNIDRYLPFQGEELAVIASSLPPCQPTYQIG